MKDLYSLLGVNKRADKDEIKKAYRDSVKRHHPDVNETTKDAERFREITEAYETLSDNDKRRRYDERYIHQPRNSRSRDSEFMKPRRSGDNQKVNPDPYVQDFQNDYHTGFPGEKRTLSCIIHITPQEAQNDIEYPYTITVARPCPHCSSLFFGPALFCPYCKGSHYIYTRKEIIINIPKGTESGTCRDLSLDHVGLRGVNLRVKLWIS